MDILKQFAASGIVPVVVLENAEDAVPTARALLAGQVAAGVQEPQDDVLHVQKTLA